MSPIVSWRKGQARVTRVALGVAAALMARVALAEPCACPAIDQRGEALAPIGTPAPGTELGRVSLAGKPTGMRVEACKCPGSEPQTTLTRYELVWTDARSGGATRQELGTSVCGMTFAREKEVVVATENACGGDGDLDDYRRIELRYAADTRHFAPTETRGNRFDEYKLAVQTLATTGRLCEAQRLVHERGTQRSDAKGTDEAAAIDEMLLAATQTAARAVAGKTPRAAGDLVFGQLFGALTFPPGRGGGCRLAGMGRFEGTFTRTSDVSLQEFERRGNGDAPTPAAVTRALDFGRLLLLGGRPREAALVVLDAARVAPKSMLATRLLADAFFDLSETWYAEALYTSYALRGVDQGALEGEATPSPEELAFVRERAANLAKLRVNRPLRRGKWRDVEVERYQSIEALPDDAYELVATDVLPRLVVTLRTRRSLVLDGVPLAPGFELGLHRAPGFLDGSPAARRAAQPLYVACEGCVVRAEHALVGLLAPEGTHVRTPGDCAEGPACFPPPPPHGAVLVAAQTFELSSLPVKAGSAVALDAEGRVVGLQLARDAAVQGLPMRSDSLLLLRPSGAVLKPCRYTLAAPSVVDGLPLAGASEVVYDHARCERLVSFELGSDMEVDGVQLPAHTRVVTSEYHAESGASASPFRLLQRAFLPKGAAVAGRTLERDTWVTFTYRGSIAAIASYE